MLKQYFFFRFCVGDQFYLLDNKILCGSDYEERMLFASLQVTIVIIISIRPLCRQYRLVMRNMK